MRRGRDRAAEREDEHRDAGKGGAGAVRGSYVWLPTAFPIGKQISLPPFNSRVEPETLRNSQKLGETLLDRIENVESSILTLGATPWPAEGR
jgi:hypothetical protein